MADSISISSATSVLPEEYYGRVDARAQAGPVMGMKDTAPGIKDPSSGQRDQADISAKGRELAQNGSAKKSKSAEELTPEQLAEVRRLAETDRKVRVHEQAHVAAGGSLVRGGPSYSFRTGPDGVRYAVGGEVDIDTSPVKNDPDATIRKAVRVQAAALAPAEPSGQDRAIASRASKMAMQAQMDKLALQNARR